MASREFRVRPVQRHLVTDWEEGRGSRVIGEFQSTDLADEIVAALQRSNPGSAIVRSDGSIGAPQGLEYVIVAAHMHEVENLAYFAYSETDAERVKADAEERHGFEFRIYSRPNTGGYAPAAPTKPHANLPSRYAIGEVVIRKACDVRQLTGALHAYDAEQAVVWGIHFYSGKVCYDVTFPSGRTGETVDSVELEDLN